jgi:LacI family transcriptional regulator
MKDIAHDLGVSVVTVSKVLRNHADISEETRERVLNRMKELNYRPNLSARALVTGKTHIIGLVVPDLVHAFFAQVAKGLSTVLRKKGYSLIISSSEEDAALEQQEIEQMLARRVDALIVASAQRTVESFRRIEEQRTPYILLDRKFTTLSADFVGVDDEAVGRIATEHLIENGCRLIAHLGGRGVSTATGRLEGYRQTLARHGLDVPPQYVICREHGDDLGDITGYEAMKTLLQLDPTPDSVFCHNDPTALGAMKAILEAGLRIPEDIAVAGCGNVMYAEFLRIPLTTFDQDSEAIGERAGKLVLSLLESKTRPQPKTILLEPKLIVRESSLKHTTSS